MSTRGYEDGSKPASFNVLTEVSLCIAEFRNVSRCVAGRIVADVSKERVAFIPKGHILEDWNLKLIAACVGRRRQQLLEDRK